RAKADPQRIIELERRNDLLWESTNLTRAQADHIKSKTVGQDIMNAFEATTFSNNVEIRAQELQKIMADVISAKAESKIKDATIRAQISSIISQSVYDNLRAELARKGLTVNDSRAYRLLAT